MTPEQLWAVGLQPVYCTWKDYIDDKGKRVERWTPLTGTTGNLQRAPFEWTDPPIEAFEQYFRPPLHAFVMDVDDHDGSGTGPATITKMGAELGPLPATHWITSRGPDDGNRKLLFRIPDDLIVNNVAFEAYGGSVDSIRTGHRFARAPGQVHHKTGQPEVCYGLDGKPCALPDVNTWVKLPERWVTYFRTFRAAPSSNGTTEGSVRRLSRAYADALRARAWEDYYATPGDVGQNARGKLLIAARVEAQHRQLTEQDDDNTTIEELARQHPDYDGGELGGSADKALDDGVAHAQRHRWEEGGDDPQWLTELWESKDGEWLSDVARTAIVPPSTAPMAVARIVAEDYRRDDELTLRRWRGAWMRWREAHWHEADDDDLTAALYLRLEHAVYTKDGKPSPWAPNRRKVGDVAHALASITQLDSEIDPPTWLDDADHGGALVACSNGLLDVRTRSLIPLTPRYFNLVSVPFAYDPDAGAPVAWLEFLEQLWPDDPTSIETLQQWFGYAVGGSTALQKMLLMVGPKRGGKGTIARILQALVGARHCVGPTLASLSTNFGLEPLIGKPLAVVSDARLSGQHDPHVIVERLLSITGEDTLTIDRKFRTKWTGRLPTRVMVLTNEPPALRDASGAVISRFVALQMTESWLGREDITLEAKLRAELPGILNWALDGLVSLVERGRFTEPASGAETAVTMLDDASPESAFVRECCVISAGLQTTPTQLFAVWVGWCNRNGRDHPGTVQSFCRKLKGIVPGVKDQRPREADGSRPRQLLGIAPREAGPRWSATHSIVSSTPSPTPNNDSREYIRDGSRTTADHPADAPPPALQALPVPPACPRHVLFHINGQCICG